MRRLNFIFILLFLNASVLAYCPETRIILDDTAEYCEHCREHGMEGWIVKFRLENLSSWPIYILGVGFWDENEDRTHNPEHFFVDSYRQWRRLGTSKWLSEGKAETPPWVKNKSYLTDSKLVVQQLAFYEWDSAEGWNFDVQQIVRFNAFVGFEEQKEPCVISSDSFFLDKLDYSDSAKIVVVKE